MPTSQVSGATLIRDTLFAIKNFLSGAISDPITNRPTNEAFIMTSYPTRAVTYPLITIKDMNSFDQQRLGFQSEFTQHFVDTEIRIWANNTAQRDRLADEIFNDMKNNQFGGGSAFAEDFGLHDFKLLSSVNVDEADGPKSKVMTFRWMAIA